MLEFSQLFHVLHHSILSCLEKLSISTTSEYKTDETMGYAIGTTLLETNHVEERNYFINRISTELSPIPDDLWKAHKKDSETATDTTLKDLILENIPIPQVTEEDPDEDVAKIFFNSFCSTSGINPSTVPREEYNVFKKLMHRSKKYKEMLKSKKNARKAK